MIISLFRIYTMKTALRHTLGNGLVLSCIAALLLSQACSGFRQEEDAVLPGDTATTLPEIRLSVDSGKVAQLKIEQLKINRKLPFTFSAEGFAHGSFLLAGDTAIRYQTTDANWTLDSGTIRVCQSGKCRKGILKVRNLDPRIQSDTQTSTPVTPMPLQVISSLGSKNFQNLPGMEETGSTIDSIWGFYFTAEISANKKQIQYFAGGGLGAGLYLGTDQIYYRIRRADGKKFRGFIPIAIDDSCLVRAKTDVRTVPGNGILSAASLLANDGGCNNALPADPKLLRLELAPYGGKKKKATQFGEIRDTTDGSGNPAFFYRRTQAGTQADTSWYFLEEGDLQRITRAFLILQ